MNLCRGCPPAIQQQITSIILMDNLTTQTT
jgi:hypothetical protein